MLGEAASGRTKFGKRFCFQWDPVFPHNIAYVIYKDNAFMHEMIDTITAKNQPEN